ncbi:Calx-beta domain-containing protein [Roseobacter sp.]|uniref:Calx-beta domain-containing protein n=1 Tax=Roseobacter sp. TaxID=1907202 RepID=UPI002966E240|nr:Calx-beta domain-containing protein [Roseobacter sp.]MDW3181526.1 hypothetical protein [Roseobacter sp.]
MSGGAGADEFGGFIEFFDGDTITDFSIEDSISVFDGDFNQLAANAEIVGNELRLDTTGDGVAEAVLILENGYTGPVRVTGGPIGGPEAVVFEIEAAGRFAAVVEEGSGVATVTVTRTGDVLSAATVDLTVSGAGLDPVEAADLTTPFGTPVQLSFAPGEEQITYEIGITGDLATEPAEDLAVTLSNPASAGAGGPRSPPPPRCVRILDDDISAACGSTARTAPRTLGGITCYRQPHDGDPEPSHHGAHQIPRPGVSGRRAGRHWEPDLPQAGQVEIAVGASTASFTIAVVPDTVAETHDDILATISTGPDWPAGN